MQRFYFPHNTSKSELEFQNLRVAVLSVLKSFDPVLMNNKKMPVQQYDAYYTRTMHMVDTFSVMYPDCALPILRELLLDSLSTKEQIRRELHELTFPLKIVERTPVRELPMNCAVLMSTGVGSIMSIVHINADGYAKKFKYPGDKLIGAIQHYTAIMNEVLEDDTRPGGEFDYIQQSMYSVYRIPFESTDMRIPFLTEEDEKRILDYDNSWLFEALLSGYTYRDIVKRIMYNILPVHHKGLTSIELDNRYLLCTREIEYE